MKYLLISALIIFLSACIGTDIIEDQVTTISILPDDGELVNDSEVSGLVGAEKSFNASATNDRGKTFVPEITWTSSDNEVASITEDGVVQLLSRGKTKITASGYGLESNVIKIIVTTGVEEPALISFAEVNTTLPVGQSVQLNASVLNADGDPLETEPVVWSTSDETIFTVSSNGLVSAVSEGSATITASIEDVSSELTFSTTAPVNEVRVGEFRGINGYRASGNVELTEINGELQLDLLTNFSTSNGPGLYLYLANNERSIAGGIEIGQLRNNSGADTYQVPDGITFDQFEYVIIYCKPFGVGFGTAQLD